MNMPGFTGETSLYKTRGHYCAMASTPTGLAGGRVLPQLPIGWCMADCDEQYPWGSIDNWACKYGCVGAGTDGGGGGGGPSEPPEPVCGPCIRGRQHCVIPGRGSYSAPCSVEPA
jgi:hypothetical protein